MDELEKTKQEIVLLIKQRTLIDHVPLDIADIALHTALFEGKYNWIDVIDEDLIDIGVKLTIQAGCC